MAIYWDDLGDFANSRFFFYAFVGRRIDVCDRAR